MRSGKFLIAASKKFAGRKVEMVSTFRLTILFDEFFGQSNRRISPASLEFYFESRSSFLDSRDEINPCEDHNDLFAANFHDDRPENRLVEIGL